MKTILFAAILFVSLLVGCNNKPSRKFLGQGYEKWKGDYVENHSIRKAWKAYQQGDDTLVYFTNFYPSGKLKSKVVMRDDLLDQIIVVLDTLGNKVDFGTFKDGNGCVMRFTSDEGIPDEQGCYVNGNKEGWWKDYPYKGYIQDSIFYKNGFIQRKEEKHKNALEQLLDAFGPMKNNLYE